MAQDNKSHQVSSTGAAFGITSLVTGIIAFLTGWIFFLSIPIGAVAIVFGALGIRKPSSAGSKGMAIAGLVAGIVGFAFGLGILVIGLVASLSAGAPSVPSSTPTFYRY